LSYKALYIFLVLTPNLCWTKVLKYFKIPREFGDPWQQSEGEKAETWGIFCTILLISEFDDI
jgi:hypothetical protein